mgnify:CR=1 FL=1
MSPGSVRSRPCIPLLTLAELALREGRPDAALAMIERASTRWARGTVRSASKAAWIAAAARAARGDPTGGGRGDRVARRRDP